MSVVEIERNYGVTVIRMNCPARSLLKR